MIQQLKNNFKIIKKVIKKLSKANLFNRKINIVKNIYCKKKSNFTEM